jgi:predicted nuclease of predicted toxin-antitoxin system
MKVLVDMNLSPDWARFLAEAGFEAVHWSNVGSKSATDSELMQWAAENDHIILTADLDFGAMTLVPFLRRRTVSNRASSKCAATSSRRVQSAVRSCGPSVKPTRNCLMVH